MLEERSNHIDCGDTKGRLYTRKVKGGYVSFCHNCGFKEFIKDGITTPSNTIKNYISSVTCGDTTESFVKEIRLPSDYSQSTIPREGYAWLYKYNILDTEIKQYGIGYSERYKRLILPVFEGESLLYWQGRYLHTPSKEHPKYLNVRQSGAKSVFFTRMVQCGGDVRMPSKTLVVVEDILSAIKCGRYMNSLALLGSYFPTEILNKFKPYDNILIYLDNDKWKEAIKAAQRFNKLTGKTFKVINEFDDPKDLSDIRLKEILHHA